MKAGTKVRSLRGVWQAKLEGVTGEIVEVVGISDWVLVGWGVYGFCYYQLENLEAVNE